ncbi:MAG: hypothetical protein JW932_19605 [Deltaproteobacteria bacterium]|nr:hypothetical protein [Deltaproteobacteria bacterium]
MNDVKTIIKDIEKFKPIPRMAHKIMAVAEDPDMKVVSFDSALADLKGIQKTSNVSVNTLNDSPFALALVVQCHRCIDWRNGDHQARGCG